MIDVEAEVKKYQTCKDRSELERRVQEYKNLAIQNAKNLTVSGQYIMVSNKLKEMADRLPAPRLVKYPSAGSAPVKTATIGSEEKAKISADWEKKSKK